MAMGGLMHTLHEDQRRLEECAETIPGLLVMEFEAPARRSPSEFRLMTQCAEQRELIEALQTRNSVLAENNAALARRVADLSQDLRTLTGENAKPDRGCHIATVYCDEASVLVEYDYTAAEEAVMDVESPRCGPGHPEVIEPLRAFINGHWCNLHDVLSALSDDALIQRIGETREEFPA